MPSPLRAWRLIGPALLVSLFAGPGLAQAPAVSGPVAAEGRVLPGHPPDEAAAVRFLNRATFGATQDSVRRLMQLGYGAWLDEQFALPASLQLPVVEADYDPDPAAVFTNDTLRREAWWQNAVEGPDQLRQKMAWALSQVFVVSVAKPEVLDQALGTAHFYDQLATQGLGSYRALLETITLSPIMGEYLDMLGNAKTNVAAGTRPDENYAREVLQLFSIGLVELAPDGEPLLDAGGLPIPTYTQPVVEGFAKVFTGWAHAGKPNFGAAPPSDPVLRSITPMELYPDEHDPAAKLLLGGVELPPGQSGGVDLTQALDQIAAHPNVGPFLGRLLIQRFVTSNPTSEYMARASAAFQASGGDLGSLLRAVLLDPEARLTPAEQPEGHGKLREPLLRQVALWRTFEGRSASGTYHYPVMSDTFEQAPLQAPSVFNFFSSDFSPSGEFAEFGAAAPEFQITTHKRIADVTNQLMDTVLKGYAGFPYPQPDAVLLDLAELTALADDPAALVERIDLLWTGRALTPELRARVTAYAALVPLEEYTALGAAPGAHRVAEALALIVTSPEGALQR